MHDAEALEHLDVPVVHACGDGDDERLLALEQDVQHVLADVANLGGPPKLRARHRHEVIFEM